MLCRFCAVSGATRNAKSRHGGIGKELLDNIFELWYKRTKETGKTVKPAPLLGSRGLGTYVSLYLIVSGNILLGLMTCRFCAAFRDDDLYIIWGLDK